MAGFASRFLVDFLVPRSDDVADDAADHRTREAAPQEIVAKPRSNPLGRPAGEGRQPPSGHGAGPLERRVSGERRQRRVDQGLGDSANP